VKNSITIFLLSLLLTAQYAKQLSYMGCKLYSKVNATITCDCEKIITPSNTSTDYEHTTMHRHLQVDEYVNFTKSTYSCFSLVQNTKILNGFYTPNISTGFLAKLVKPPEA
jgi:hypothetical protein